MSRRAGRARKAAAVLLLGSALLGAGGASAQAGAGGASARREPGSGPVSFAVSFDTEDGFTLHGDLVSAGSTESPVAILLHMYRHDRSTWEPLIPALVKAGITVLALDQRAHGESTHRGDREVRVGDLSREAFAELVRDGPRDVAAARRYLARNGFAVDHIALVGASYGCTVSLLASGQEGVRALVLLSPGTAYFGVDVRDEARRFAHPVLLVAAEDDAAAARSARALAASRSAPTTLRLLPRGGHGTRLLSSQPQLVDEIRAFLEGALGGDAGP